jgi:membrane protein DedA with SNARE-associated domain
MAPLAKGGYALIGLLMAVESSILPLPSEVVIPPAAHLAHTGQIPLSLWGIVLAGTVGSWLGATLMYWAARIAGRPLVLRYGRYIFIKPEKVEGAERWAAHYGGMGIFISRLRPWCGISSFLSGGNWDWLTTKSFRSTRCSVRRSGAPCCAGFASVKIGQDESAF